MQITNKHGLPEELVRAVMNDPYSRGAADYSVSDLNSPVRLVLLKRRHDGLIVEDVSERIWALFGQGLHAVAQMAGLPSNLQEERFFADVLGVQISGQPDLYTPENGGTIVDFKTTSVWTRIYGSRDDDWAKQLNCYAYLMRQGGWEVNALKVVAIYRDWSRGKRLSSGPDYPRQNAEGIEVNLWPDARVEAYIHGRVQALIDAEGLADDDLPLCTQEERWATGDAWAVKKGNNKRAIKLHDSAETANKHAERLAATDGKTYGVEHRPAAWRRCEDYCAAAPFCNQFQAYKQTQNTQQNTQGETA